MRNSPYLLCLLSLLILSTFPALPASAELPEATWAEICIASVDEERDSREGTTSEPENILAEAQSATAGQTASVVYNSSGPPAVTVEVNGTADEPSELFGLADCRIAWHFRVVASGPIPARVEPVPVNVIVSGWANANGTPENNAHSGATLMISDSAMGDLMTLHQVIATSSGEADARSINAQLQTFSVLPDVQLDGSLAVSATNGAGGTAGAGTSKAGAYLEHSIEVAAIPIPGDGTLFSDLFEIEYGPGYWALGSVPVRSTTWGDMKNRFQE